MTWRNYLKDVKVLVVDDQEFLRLLLRHTLKVLGCRHISEASNVETAWDMILTDKPDLLILDWEIDWGQGIDGIELAKMVRQSENSPDQYMPIIMLSAHSERQRITTARDAGITEFVTKPISANTLFSRLNEVILHPRRFIRTDNFFGPDRRRKDMTVDFERRNPNQECEIKEISALTDDQPPFHNAAR